MVFKLMSAVVAFVVAVIGCLLPIFVAGKWPRVLSVLQCLSGGVLISAGLVHILADAHNQVSDYLGAIETFPWAELSAGCGFVLTLCMAKFGESFHKIKRSISRAILSVPRWRASQAFPVTPAYGTLFRSNPTMPSGASLDGVAAAVDAATTQQSPSAAPTPRQPLLGSMPNPLHASSMQGSRVAGTSGKFTAVIMVVALGLHSSIEGLALGVTDSLSGATAILVAVAGHKGLAAFALSSRLRLSYSPLPLFLMLAIWCLISPVACLAGALGLGTAEGIVLGIIMAVAAGTFLFIGIVEVLLPELDAPRDIVYKVIATAVGFGSMSAVAAVL